MYPVHIRHIRPLDDIDTIFDEAVKNSKSIIGAKFCYDESPESCNYASQEISYMSTLYFSHETEAIMFELKYL